MTQEEYNKLNGKQQSFVDWVMNNLGWGLEYIPSSTNAFDKYVETDNPIILKNQLNWTIEDEEYEMAEKIKNKLSKQK